MKKLHYTQGLSLVEVVVSIGLFSIVMLIVANFFVSFNSTFSIERALIETAGSAGSAVRETEVLVRPALQILALHVFAGGTHTSSSTALVLELPAIDGSGQVIVGAFDYAVIYLSGTELYRILETDAASARTPGTKLLSSTVTALSFTYDDIDFTQVEVVTIDITTGALVKDQLFGTNLREQIRLRNFISS